MKRGDGIKIIASAKLRGEITLEALFCFPALRFDAFSPYRDSRNCCAPKPGKEKQKSYDYRSAILIVHGHKSFLSVFTPLMRKIWREVTRNMAAQLRHGPLPRLTRARGGVGAEKHSSQMRCVVSTTRRNLILAS